ncbi:MAG TPA: hypothetical protein VE360_08595 [Pyrinomonadaceae bacterium]|nr:hypothetical protein [Pyrinomonadaceae bacterium]
MGDLILFLYAAAFLRQYLWVVPDDRLAWALVALAAAPVFYLHWRTKDVDAVRTPAAFWPLVALPLFFFYALRAALPDMSWDVLDYRLINAERALTGWPMRAGDFFPVRFPFNPAPDMVMGLSRRLLGYRLGTLVNFAVLVWTGTVLEKLLRTFVTRPTLRCLCVLLLLLTEHLLFEVNNYMVDLLALPLMLEATRLALSAPADARAERPLFARIGLYLGAGLAFKLTNLAFAIPIVLLCAYRVATSEGERRRFDMKAPLYGLVCLLLPLVPYSLYIYAQTGSPVFPLYNWVFQSEYWPVVDPRTERWGPIVDDPRFKHMRAWEVLLWPLLLPFRVEHTAGDLGPHWGRVSVAFVASVVALAWRGTDARVRSLAFVALAGAVLWSAASGMLRYAMYVELVGGAVALYLVAVLLRRSRDAPRTRTTNRAVAVLIVCVLVAQSLSACVYGYRFEWGGRPTVFQGASSHLREARHFLRDRSYRQFLTPREAALFEPGAVWVESGPLTSGVQVMLAPEAPQWCVYMPEFFNSAEGRARFARAVERARGAKIYSLCLAEDFKSATDYIRGAGLGVGRVTGLSLPFYSHAQRFHTSFLIEVLPPGVTTGGDAKQVTAADAALLDPAFEASLRWAQPPPANMRAGETRALRVLVANASNLPWPALGRSDNGFRLFLGNHWLDAAGASVVNDDGRASLPHDLMPGEEVELTLDITAPRAPGVYQLEVDLLQERAAWFGLKGSKTLRTKVTVEE